MEKSDSIAALAAALSKAQGAIAGAVRDKANPYYKSTYADIASVWEACRKPLSDNGLAIMQIPCNEEPEVVTIETLLTHSSGEWIKSRLRMRPVKADPQGVGSCITYARRYSLMAMVGVAPEDDDGNAASQAQVSVKGLQYVPPQPSDPRESKTYHIAPEREKDVPEILGEAQPDEKKIIDSLKQKLSGLMLGFSAKQKKEFYDFVVQNETVDALQGFVDDYFHYREKYMAQKGIK